MGKVERVTLSRLIFLTAKPHVHYRSMLWLVSEACAASNVVRGVVKA